MIGEDSLLERVTAAAEERHLSHNSLLARAEGLVLETLPSERVGEFYEEATRGRSASHHLQVKAALALLYRYRRDIFNGVALSRGLTRASCSSGTQSRDTGTTQPTENREAIGCWSIRNRRDDSMGHPRIR